MHPPPDPVQPYRTNAKSLIPSPSSRPSLCKFLRILNNCKVENLGRILQRFILETGNLNSRVYNIYTRSTESSGTVVVVVLVWYCVINVQHGTSCRLQNQRHWHAYKTTKQTMLRSRKHDNVSNITNQPYVTLSSYARVQLECGYGT